MFNADSADVFHFLAQIVAPRHAHVLNLKIALKFKRETGSEVVCPQIRFPLHFNTLKRKTINMMIKYGLKP